MKIKTLWTVVIAMAVISVGVPYTFLGDIPRFWASYLFWTLLAVFTLVTGYFHLKEWGVER
ncbi:MAG: hypothetical protein ACLFVL_03955 [Candidatus Aenigmatarchaeota archaeon]